ncbi:hypothetical protein Dda_4799 [Drechslerella dactyloides]|uniref:Tetratricopeptide SHNi-TPR domain-containing protein n=1 Tax=Drechslerella dactyloides TaxID=74499 RepID=A0AAD6NKY2_DREDA|nr:hypothetical protein Dda_4799 [Drechslerella dactyloides]
MSETTPTKPEAASPEQQLEALTAEAAVEYTHKRYSKAAELYAEAAELQASINGEDSPLNADLLYLYGRALYNCGLERSDVLGTGVSSGEAAREKQRSAEITTTTKPSTSAAAAAKKRKPAATADITDVGGAFKKGVIAISGDDNFLDDSDGEDADSDANSDAGPDGDDFTLAWEILDLARVLFNKRLENPPDDTDTLRKIKERLADVHDILGEVSLESESFKQACIDLEEALKIKQDLYPVESTLITEAHYKLSLALEFASQGAGEGDADKDVSPEDQKKGREQAVKHMRSAIASCRKRVEAEEKAIQAATGDKVGDKPKDEAEKAVEEGRDLVRELEMKLRDLMAPPAETVAAAVTKAMGEEQMAGILSAMRSGNPDDAKKMFADIISGANDISGAVRKKARTPAADAPSPAAAAAAVPHGAGSKRKAEDDDDAPPATTAAAAAAEKPTIVAQNNSKKPRVTTEEEERAAEEGTLIE